VGKCTDAYDNKEDLNHLNGSNKINEIEAVIVSQKGKARTRDIIAK
jgi:hypothetical protein